MVREDDEQGTQTAVSCRYNRNSLCITQRYRSYVQAGYVVVQEEAVVVVVYERGNLKLSLLLLLLLLLLLTMTMTIMAATPLILPITPR